MTRFRTLEASNPALTPDGFDFVTVKSPALGRRADLTLFAPRQAAGVIGFTAAIAAYGPFLFGMLFAWSFGTFKSAVPIFYGLAAFFAFNVALNWWMYARRGAANPC